MFNWMWEGEAEVMPPGTEETTQVSFWVEESTSMPPPSPPPRKYVEAAVHDDDDDEDDDLGRVEPAGAHLLSPLQ